MIVFFILEGAFTFKVEDRGSEVIFIIRSSSINQNIYKRNCIVFAYFMGNISN